MHIDLEHHNEVGNLLAALYLNTVSTVLVWKYHSLPMQRFYFYFLQLTTKII